VQRQVFPVPRSFDWLLVGAMALVLLTFSLVFWGDRSDNSAQNPPTPTPQQVTVDKNSLAQIQQDNELLSNINQELSEGLRRRCSRCRLRTRGQQESPATNNEINSTEANYALHS
jgi:hypothetical protein